MHIALSVLVFSILILEVKFIFLPLYSIIKNKDEKLRDLDKEKKTEQELERQTLLLQEMVDLLNDTQKIAKIGSWEVDLLKNKVYWSDQVYRIHKIEIGTEILLEEAINFYREDYRVVIENAINTAISNKKEWDEECILINNKGDEMWVRAIGYPVFEDKAVVKLQGLFMDIDAEKRIQKKLIARKEELKESLSDKELLIGEVHHRVKNNLALISSFLQLEGMGLGSSSIEEILNINILRIKSISTIHEIMYQQSSFSEISVFQTLEKVLPASFAMNGVNTISINRVGNQKKVLFNINQAVSFALLINEMIFEAFKHNDTDDILEVYPALDLKITEEEKMIRVSFFNSDFNRLLKSLRKDYKKGKVEIVEVLMKQLDSDLFIDQSNTEAWIEFKKTQKKGASSSHI